MILLGDFFTIDTLENGNATLRLNPAHRIFDGHFPGQPVVPGVCMMQMMKEILETMLGQETRLISAASAKFLAMIDPRQTPVVQAELAIRTDSDIVLEGRLFWEGTTFLKYRAVFRPV